MDNDEKATFRDCLKITKNILLTEIRRRSLNYRKMKVIRV